MFIVHKTMNAEMMDQYSVCDLLESLSDLKCDFVYLFILN